MISVDTPRSTATRQLRYWARDRVLEVTFRTGGTYTYWDVGAAVWEDLRALLAGSGGAGKYVRRHIVGQYSTTPGRYRGGEPQEPLPDNVVELRHIRQALPADWFRNNMAINADKKEQLQRERIAAIKRALKQPRAPGS